MPDIDIKIIDPMGNTSTLTLPDDEPLNSLVPRVVDEANLRAKDDKGRHLNYQFFSRRTLSVLKMEGTLFSNGVLTGDALRTVPGPHGKNLEFEMLTKPETGTILTIHQRPRISIGRSIDNDIVIRDPIVSRQHGELLWQDGLHIYRDLNSANGSYVNNLAVTEPMPVSVNSVLSLGESIRLLYKEATPISIARKKGIRPVETPPDSKISTNLTPLPRAGIFISHAPQVDDKVRPIVESLRRANFHVFWGMEIPPGTNVQEAIESSMKYSDILVPIISQNSSYSDEIREQWHRFIANRKPIVVVQLSECAVPAQLQDYPIISPEEGHNRLMQALVANIMEAIL